MHNVVYSFCSGRLLAQRSLGGTRRCLCDEISSSRRRATPGGSRNRRADLNPWKQSGNGRRAGCSQPDILSPPVLAPLRSESHACLIHARPSHLAAGAEENRAAENAMKNTVTFVCLAMPSRTLWPTGQSVDDVVGPPPAVCACFLQVPAALTGFLMMWAPGPLPAAAFPGGPPPFRVMTSV